MKKTVIKVYKPSRRRGTKTLNFTDFDYFLLKQIYKHRLLSSAQLYYFLKYFQMEIFKERQPHRDSFTKRLTLLENHRLIYRVIDKQNRSMPHHFRLGPVGYQLLIDKGITTKEKAESLNRELIKSGNVPGFHKQGISSIAILAECELHKRGIRFRSSNITEFEENGMFIENNIVPDWIIEKDNRYVCLEIDTASERGDTITDKATKYIQLAKKYPSKNFFVVFSVTDEYMEMLNIEDESKEQVDRTARVRNLKKKIPIATEWGDNLHFYAVKARRTAAVVGNILSKEYVPEDNGIYKQMGSWLAKLFKLNSPAFPMSLLSSQMDASNVYPKNAPVKLKSNLFMELSGEKALKWNVVLFLGEEGSVHNYQLLELHQDLVSKKVAGYTPLHEIWVLYRSEAEAVEDILSMRFNHVWYNYLQADMQVIPKFYKLLNQNKKSLVPYL